MHWRPWDLPRCPASQRNMISQRAPSSCDLCFFVWYGLLDPCTTVMVHPSFEQEISIGCLGARGGSGEEREWPPSAPQKGGPGKSLLHPKTLVSRFSNVGRCCGPTLGFCGALFYHALGTLWLLRGLPFGWAALRLLTDAIT